MKPASLIIALITGMGWAAFADQPVAKPAAKQKAMRDPFWPVSYNLPARQPETAGTPAEAATPSIRWPELPVRGSSRGPDGSYFVLIEGTGVVRPGEVVSIFKDNLWFHWQISGIDAGGLRAIKLGTSRDRNDVPQPKQSPSTSETQP